MGFDLDEAILAAKQRLATALEDDVEKNKRELKQSFREAAVKLEVHDIIVWHA